MKECPNGHKVSDTVKYCPKCGAEIQDKLAEKIRFCKKCGHKRNGIEKFCSHCGYPFYGESEYTSSNIDRVRNNAFNKIIISFLIVVPLLFVCGYYIYNHIEEEKRLEKERIEENERIAEAERKRIEEENNPTKRLYKFAQQGNWAWEYMFSNPFSLIPSSNDDRKSLYTQVLFLYPFSESTGKLSYIEFTENSFDDYCGYQKLTSVYEIRDNILRATLQSFDDFEGRFFKKGDNKVYRIENNGDKVNLIEIGDSKDYTWRQMEPITQKGKQITDVKVRKL